MKWNGKTLLLWLNLDLKIIRFHEWGQSFRSNDSSRWINHKMEHTNEKTSIWKWYFVFELNQHSNSIIILFRYVNDWSFVFLYLNRELSREKRNIPLVGRNCGSSNRIERSMWQYYAMQLIFFFQHFRTNCMLSWHRLYLHFHLVSDLHRLCETQSCNKEDVDRKER